ncbi:hypothetical protein AWJ19_03125 [Paenibacillus sp. DMB5]|nr:hypothetical protein AWJ19_03125 [Paenibacillus sp. DMB5]
MFILSAFCWLNPFYYYTHYAYYLFMEVSNIDEFYRGSDKSHECNGYDSFGSCTEDWKELSVH